MGLAVAPRRRGIKETMEKWKPIRNRIWTVAYAGITVAKAVT
jgi:hypothetical protein